MTAPTRAAARDVDGFERAFRDAEFDYLPRWRRGEVVPAAITLHLDARGLYGPDVDLACGAVEPAVDEWEAGTRYPTWPQLIALARLVDVTPAALFAQPAQPARIFICGRPRSRAHVYDPPPPIRAYPEHVWRPVVDGFRDTLFDLAPSGALL